MLFDRIFIDNKNEKLSTRITFTYIILFIIVLVITSILVMFITEQFLAAGHQRQIVDMRDVIINLCEENKAKIMSAPYEERLQIIVEEAKNRNSQFDFLYMYLYLKDNLGYTYQPLKEIIDFEQINFDIDLDINKTIILYDKNYHDDEQINVKFISNKEHEFLFVNTIVQFTDKYSVKIYLMKDVQESISFIQDLGIVLIIVNIIGFIFIILVGRFTTKKALIPLTNIATVSKNITANNLHERIPEPNTNDEIDTLIKSLNRMIEGLEKSFNAQKRFVNDASHELRLPLTVIQGYLDILNSWGLKDEDVVKESLEAINQESSNMKNLVEKLLFLARIENNKLKTKFKPVPLNELVEQVVSDFTLVSPDHNFIIERNDPCEILADRNLIQQIFRSTMENSIKYTDVGGSISISLLNFNNYVQIKITDTGIGIPDEDLSKICDRFYRVDTSRTKNTGGTGLGLSIVSSIVDLHSGNLSVHSKYGEWTEVLITLPKK